MSGGTSSANPEDLDVFVTKAGAATSSLSGDLASSTPTIEAFLTAPCEGRFKPAGSDTALHQAQSLVTDDQTDERWIAGIRKAFIEADSTTLSDAAIGQSLSAQGIDTTAPAAMTADEPVYQGTPMYSGWSDDPVATGTGHFLEQEQDLVMPDRLGVIAWTRTYSSRFLRAHPVGRGWASWASTRLDPGPADVGYRGPDGQEAAYVRLADGYVRPVGMDAELVDEGPGFGLRWSWTGRFAGQRWHFGGDGRLEQVDDPFGGCTTTDHDATGRLVRLTHEGGRHLELGWEGERLTTVTASDGRVVRYHHDGGDLVGVDRPAGAEHLTVDGQGRILEVHDADGVRLVANTYDDDGRVLTQTSRFGRTTTYRYLVPNTLVVAGDDGRSTLFRHDVTGRLVETRLADGSRLSRRFDAQGNPVEVVGADGGLTRRTFDVDGNCVREVDPAGGVTERAFDGRGRLTRTVDAGGRVTDFEYRGDDLLPSRQREPLGAETRYEVVAGLIASATDADGVTARFVHDADGQVVARTDGTGHTTTMARSASGHLTEVVSPLGRRTTMEVDGAGRLLGLTEPGGGRWALTRSPAGRILTRTDPTGATLTATYGDHGELVALTDPSGATSELEWGADGEAEALRVPTGGSYRYERDGAGRLRSVTDPTGQDWTLARSAEGFFGGIVDPLGHGATSTFDAAGRQTSVVTPDGAHLELRYDGAGRLVDGTCPEQSSSCHVVHDESGRPVETWIDGRPTTRMTYTPAGRPQSLSRPDGAVWRWVYDTAGRPVEAVAPEGTTRIAYDDDGDVARVVDPTGVVTALERDIDARIVATVVGGQRTEYAHDGAGRVVSERTGTEQRRYAYDGRGLLTGATDALGAVTRFEHDPAALLSAVVAADGGRWEIERDACGRQTATTDPLGRRSTYELDAAGRVVGAMGADGRRTAWRWSPGGRLEAVTGDDRPDATVGRVPSARQVSVTRGTTTTVVDLDGRGRLAAITTDGARTAWSWTDDGREVSVEDPSGRVTRTTLDAAGLAVGIETAGLAPVRLGRDGLGRVSVVEADGRSRRWTRDDGGALVGYDDGQGHHTRLAQEDGLVVSVRAEEGTEERFRYDAAGQLTGRSGGDGEWTWAYDVCGRLVTETGPPGTRTLHYDLLGQLTGIDGPEGTTRVDHDDRGRRIAEVGPAGVTTYRWDADDHLIGVDSPAGSHRLTYDALGLLATVDGRSVLLPGSGPLGPSLGGGLADRPVVGPVGLPVAELGPDGPTWLDADWQGSVGVHDPWGVAVGAAGPGPRPGWLGDLEVGGLVWMGHRVYDPATHAFLSRDRAAGDDATPGGSIAGYGYAYNSPLRWLDPLGLKPMTADQASAQMKAWHQGHLKEVLITAGALVVIVGVGVLTCGVGDAALAPFLTSVALGAGFSGGTTAAADYIETGHVDWGEVAMNTAVGGAVGAFAPYLPAPAALGGRVAIGASYGAAGSATSTALDEYGTGAGLDPKDILISGGIGGATGGLFHAAHWTEELKPNQLRQFQKYLDTSKTNPDPNDSSTWTNQWQNRFKRLSPIADQKTAHRGAIASATTPPAIAAATPPGAPPAPPGNPANAPHAAPVAHVAPVSAMGGVAGP